MRYRLQRHDGTDCSATMVPITVLRMVPIQRYRQAEKEWFNIPAYGTDEWANWMIELHLRKKKNTLRHSRKRASDF